MSSFFKLFILLSFTLPLVSWGQSSNEIPQDLEQANSLYNSGECEKAVVLYQKILKSPAERAFKEEALFRGSYCYLTMGDNERAHYGFSQYLKFHPDDDEARLRLVEALFNQSKFDQAANEANKVQLETLKAEAMIFRARSKVETKKYRDALDSLNSLPQEGPWKPVILYWKGVVLYKLESYDQAKQTFAQAYRSSPPDLWVKQEAQKTFQMIKKETRPLRGFVTMGYLSDSNVYQQGPTLDVRSSSVKTVDLGDTTDRAFWLSGQLTWLPIMSDEWNVSTNLSYSSPFYEKYPAYDAENWSAEVSPKYKVASGMWAGLAYQYLNSAYETNFYQAYHVVTPSFLWAPTEQLFLHFSSAVSTGIAPRQGTSYSPTAAAQYNFTDKLSARGGLIYSKATDDRATYAQTASETIQTGGTMFGNYQSLGAYVGGTWGINNDLFVSAQAGIYRTDYESEDAPQQGAGAPPDARSDMLMQFQAEVMQTMKRDEWYIGLTFARSDNMSSGFQGLASSGYTSNYTYSRNNIMLRTTFIF